ncbi:hypothetical protein [Vibrio phage PJN101]|nr:hypothetical protein [Vibrio phage PJN101]
MSKQKKRGQLGMDPGTASHQLRKQIMFSYIQHCGDDKCFQCGKQIKSVDDLSIEHKIPWLDSEDPKGLFFDLSNIAFSHLKCNVAARRSVKAVCGTETMYRKGCRCSACVEAKAAKHKKYYNPEKRKQRKQETGH